MNTIDQILSKIGRPDDFGPNWTPLARIIHRFHMEDLWLSVIPSYKNIKGVRISFTLISNIICYCTYVGLINNTLICSLQAVECC